MPNLLDPEPEPAPPAAQSARSAAAPVAAPASPQRQPRCVSALPARRALPRRLVPAALAAARPGLLLYLTAATPTADSRACAPPEGLSWKC